MPGVTYGERQRVAARHPNIFKRSVTVNLRSTWGYRVECVTCGDHKESHVGSPVTWDDAPLAWADAHRCPA